VLPFVNLTGDENADYVVDGLTDEVIAQLGALGRSRLGVIARTSVMTYRETPKTVAEIGRELNVHYVLEGSVRGDGSRVRVNAQLVSTDDEAHMWAGTFERAADEAMALQTDVAARVVRALALQLVTDRERVDRPPSTNRAAWDAYLQARYWMNRGSADAVKRAVEHLERAVAVDPEFAGAWALLAEVKHLQVMIGDVAPTDAYPRAAEAAERAVSLAPQLPDSHVAAGVVQLWFEWSPSKAQASFERALSLNGSHGVAHHDYAWTLVALGRLEEAVAHIEIARDLDPLSIRSTADVGWLRLHLRQPGEASLACEQALALAPSALEPQACFERAFIQRGLLAEAARAARTMLPTDGPLTRGWDESRTAAEKLGAVWRWRLERLEETSRTRWVSPYVLAVHHLLLGNEDAALTKLEEAVEQRVSTMVLLRTDPAVDGVRDEPRFHALLENIRPTPP
jgi:TolB-like protein